MHANGNGHSHFAATTAATATASAASARSAQPKPQIPAPLPLLVQEIAVAPISLPVVTPVPAAQPGSMFNHLPASRPTHNLYELLKALSPEFPRSVSERMQSVDQSLLTDADMQLIPDQHQDKSIAVANSAPLDDASLRSISEAESLNCKDFYLSDLWSFYDNPYGHDVSLEHSATSAETCDSELTASYVPYLSACHLYSKSGQILIDFCETTLPHLRIPLKERIAQLAHDHFPALVTAKASQFDLARSFFAISWVPIVVDVQTSNVLQGTWILYHSLDLQDTCPMQQSSMQRQHTEAQLRQQIKDESQHRRRSSLNNNAIAASQLNCNGTNGVASPELTFSPSAPALHWCHCGGICREQAEFDECRSSPNGSMPMTSPQCNGSSNQQQHQHQQVHSDMMSDVDMGDYIDDEDDCCDDMSLQAAALAAQRHDDSLPLALIGYACLRVHSQTWFDLPSPSPRSMPHSTSDRTSKVDLIQPLNFLIATGDFEHPDLHYITRTLLR